MIYRDRKFLSILTLTEGRDYVTYDELIHVLEERPSNAVYIERNGTLCGLITCGRITRNRDEKKRRVPFNKKYTYVYPCEYMHVRQFFRDKANINMLPVVSEDGRLLGDYVRYDDLICRDHAEILCRDHYVVQGLKEDAPNVVFVKPVVLEEGSIKTEMFLWWIQKLKSEGVHLQVIQSWEVKDYLNINIVRCFLYVDEDEAIGIETLNQLYRYKVIRLFVSLRGR